MRTTLERAAQEEQDAYDDRMCSARLQHRADLLLAEFATAKAEGDIEAAFMIVSEATDYGNGPLWSVEDVKSWAQYAERETGSTHAFFVNGHGTGPGSSSRREKKIIPGLVFSTLVPTMPLREAILDRLQAGCDLKPIVRASLEAMWALGEEGANWGTATTTWVITFKHDVALVPHKDGRGCHSISSFIDINRASAIAKALNIAPIEIGA